MNISTPSAQLNNGGRLYLNLYESDETIGVNGYVIDSVIHLIAWHCLHPSIFDLISIERKNYDDWICRNREKYGKIVYVEIGGIGFNPPNVKDQPAGASAPGQA